MKDVFVGKDVIELVGNAMYLEPLTVYREYIQNSVDAIDEAIDQGVLKDTSDSNIEINVNAAERKIIIRDNGTGISKLDFLSRMLSIGGSKKRKTSARGFRGVGRLAGLGYCQELIFRTRARGDVVCQLRWDVRKIKKALTQYDGEGEISDLIKDVTDFTELPSNEYPNHFFEIEMVKPIRVGGDTIMNIDRINSYISQIAPVPFSNTFKHVDKIKEHVNNFGELKEYNIFINGSDQSVVKPYENSYEISDVKSGCLKDEIEPITIENLDGDVGAVGWISHHDYYGAITPTAMVGGLRARIGNIQIGERNVFSEVFPEERFNSWTIGELYIFDKGLIPNGRRDGFEHNGHLTNLKNKLLPYAHEVTKQCRKQSSLRNIRKKIELTLNNAKMIADIIEQGSMTLAATELKRSEAKGRIAEAEALLSCAQFDEVKTSKLCEDINTLNGRLKINTTKSEVTLERFPKVERDAFNKVFDLVYACSPNQTSAKTLIDKIMTRL
jgi:hypothetical protein